MKNLLLAVLLLCSTLILAQDHAPTLEQCETNARAWKIPDNSLAVTATLQSLSFNELRNREFAMTICANEHPKFQKRFLEISDWYYFAQGSRMERYLMRHNIMNNFLDEDAAGKR